MAKPESKVRNLNILFSQSYETQLVIVRVIDSIIKQLELNLLTYSDQEKRSGFRLMNLLKEGYDGIDSGDALLTGRVLNRCLAGFEFSGAFIDRKNAKRSWASLVDDLKEIREKIISSRKQRDGHQKLTLYLNRVGDLYRDPKTKYCYEMREEGKRLEFVRALIEGYKNTHDILERTGIPTSDTLSKTKREINRKAKFYLKLDQPLIKSKPRSGYWINHPYTIKPAKE